VCLSSLIDSAALFLVIAQNVLVYRLQFCV
jgi:hypothetical protein